MKKIGFTTQTFKKVLLTGKITLDEVLEWGAQQSVEWIELRDFNLDYTQDELLEAKAAAERLNLRLHYAWDTTCFHNSADRDRIRKGIENATLFGEGTYSRVVVAPSLIDAANGKPGYSGEEFDVIVRNIREHIDAAEKSGVNLAFENSLETLPAFEALLEAIPEMRMTFDIANIFNRAGTGGETTWPHLREFTLRRKHQAPYIHLKSCKNGVVQKELLSHSDVPLPELLPCLHEEAWLCVEVPPTGDPDCCKKRVKDGLELVLSLT